MWQCFSEESVEVVISGPTRERRESLDELVRLFGRGCFEQAETTSASFAVHLAVDLLCQEREAAWYSDDCQEEGNHVLK